MSEETIEIVRHLREYTDAEIIVMDDGSAHGSTKHILDYIVDVNEFMLHFNDLFCVITQNRAIGFARGKYVVKLQDDDTYPGTKWVDDAVALFEKHQDLAIIGGRGSLSLPNDWDFTGALPWRPNCPKFQFVSMVNEAPMWIRRSDFLELGGFDEGFAPHYWGEQELCMRAWLAGKSVGWYPSGVRRCIRETGLRRRDKQPIQHACLIKNREIFKRKYGDKLERVNGLVRKRNEIA